MKSEQTTSEAYNRANVFSSGLLSVQLLAPSVFFYNEMKSSIINVRITIIRIIFYQIIIRIELEILDYQLLLGYHCKVE